jgi:hypothetical protein
MTEGRLSIATTDLDGNIIRPRTAEKVQRHYNTLRRFIKRHYTNNLVCYDQDDPLSAMDVKDLWLGPEAAKWLAASKRRVLRQIDGVNTIFAPRE